MQYFSWVALVLLAAAFGAALIAGRRRGQRRLPETPPPYSGWDEFARDVRNFDIPIDRVLARCNGVKPKKPDLWCVACGFVKADAPHSDAAGLWTHCGSCSDSCVQCRDAAGRERIEAERNRLDAVRTSPIGKAPCSFCQQLLEGGR